jgi:integral membrane sensor domain MASE1
MTASRQVSPSRLWPEIGWLALIAVAYWVVVRIGLLFTVQAEGLAVVWPASGLALAVLLLSKRRQWLPRLLVIFVANVVGDLTFDNPLPVSLGFALANTAEAAAAAWVLVHFCGPRITFTRVAEMVALCGVVVVSNGVTASC